MASASANRPDTKECDVSWSYRLATVRGITVNVHATFAIMLALVAVNWSVLGLPGVVFGLIQVALLFGCVTLHELGHAVTAQRYGIPVRQIVLLPIGGVAMRAEPGTILRLPADIPHAVYAPEAPRMRLTMMQSD